MPTALITGASGQDGSYLAERLLAEGVEVHALALPRDRPIEGVHTHVGDVADIDATRALLLEVAPDEVYNLAAISSVARSWVEPELTARVNG
ncbi:MAG TPA: GDP-mannose 4,6-dehydratase, partial [Nocardioides sp.]|nr:GDP-mannose 4,6-dehydratase [Nocardioides sp.]